MSMTIRSSSTAGFVVFSRVPRSAHMYTRKISIHAGFFHSDASDGQSRHRSGPRSNFPLRLIGLLHQGRTSGAVSAKMKIRDVIRMLQQDGWTLVRTKGSHRQFRHPEKPGTVTVAGRLGVDMPRGTLSAVMKQAGLTEE